MSLDFNWLSILGTNHNPVQAQPPLEVRWHVPGTLLWNHPHQSIWAWYEHVSEELPLNLRLLDLAASVELWIPLDLEGQLQCLPPPFAWGTIGGAAMSSIIFNALRRAGAAGAEVKRFKAHHWQASWLDSFKGTGLTTCWIYSHLFLGSKPQDMTRDSSGRSHPGHEAHVSWWRSLCRILQQACWSRYFSQANKSKPTHINPHQPTSISHPDSKFRR